MTGSVQSRVALDKAMQHAVRDPVVRTFTIFYSWQSDRGCNCWKDFIRRAAETAAERVSERLGIHSAIDADTEGVAGTPARRI